MSPPRPWARCAYVALDGNETNTPDRWEPKSRRTQEESGDSDSSSNSDGSDSDSDESSEDGLGAVGAPKPKKSGAGTSEASANPNRAAQKSMKASDLEGGSYEPSRKEREAAEKKAAQDRYWKLHQAGKTDQAKADLARLKIIREKREAAAKAREAEKAASVEDARIALERSQGIGKKS